MHRKAELPLYARGLGRNPTHSVRFTTGINRGEDRKMDKKLMEFWLDEEKGQGILLPESEGIQLGLKSAETKSVKPAETKEILPAEDKAVRKPASKSKPKDTGK